MFCNVRGAFWPCLLPRVIDDRPSTLEGLISIMLVLLNVDKVHNLAMTVTKPSQSTRHVDMNRLLTNHVARDAKVASY
jgi:hypothetical protein